MNFQFSTHEFRGMMFNPAKHKENNSIFSTFPKLNSYKIFKKSPGAGLDNNKLMLYIFCMYDQNTPYRRKFPDVKKRKYEIAIDVGFEFVKKMRTFTDPVQDFLIGRNRIANAKIVEFVRMHRNYKYTYLVAMEESFYKVMSEVVDGETNKMKELKGIQNDLEKTMDEILNTDDNPYVNDSLLLYIEEERLGLRPEEIALKLANGEVI